MQANELWGCAKHAQIGKTCCQTSEVFVSVGDRARIARFTGRNDFWHDQPPENPDYIDQDDDSTWQRGAFNDDGTRPILKRRENGDCTFLGDAGCSMPVDVRPIVCRLYPYTYTDRGIDGIDASRCPAEVFPPGSTILQVLDMRRDEADKWHQQLYTELRTGKECS
ncbi:MAG: YkgJ family cysteine cluster protein [Phycisphaerae bacterium]